MTPLKNGRNENNRLKDLIFDRGQCYSFHDKKRGIKVEQRMTRINGKYHATVDLESDEMKSYDKSNTVFSMEYNLDYLPIEIWQHSPDDGDKVKYCILKREF